MENKDDIKLSNWTFSHVDGKVKIITNHKRFFPLESLLNRLNENDALKMAGLALEGVGYSTNGVGTSFIGDLDPLDEPISEDEVSISIDSLKEEVVIPKKVFYQILHEYLYQWQMVSDDPYLFYPTISNLEQHPHPIIKFEDLNIHSLVKLTKGRRLIFGGQEHGLDQHEDIFSLDGKQFVLKYQFQNRYSLQSLEEKINKSFYKQIEDGLQYDDASLLDIYFKIRKSDVDFEYYRIEGQDYLVLSSFHEKQPSLYIWVLEGIWKVLTKEID